VAYPYLTPTLPDLTVLLNLRFGAVRSPRQARSCDIVRTILRRCKSSSSRARKQQQQQQQAGEDEEAAAAAVAGQGGNSSSSRMTSAVISLHRMAATGRFGIQQSNLSAVLSLHRMAATTVGFLSPRSINWWYHYT